MESKMDLTELKKLIGAEIQNHLNSIQEENSKSFLLDLGIALKKHDWWYQMSDDHRKWVGGRRSEKELSNMVQKAHEMGVGKQAEQLWKKFAPKEFHKFYPGKK